MDLNGILVNSSWESNMAMDFAPCTHEFPIDIHLVRGFPSVIPMMTPDGISIT